ncbi:CpsD/CapB family tyrosine-protein kinase [Jeotgalibacillus terrae]|uniref:non-specific protein-tyrosine kinase n=1 Tax=Jeotgalibacillus terrae TaxID=587735 RepID=A0ABW5ZF44_9BACL|nr:CpsD/CapB family tyrosine-protein kinase [Jeotgalibacillus terrae]MBM7579226.1 capsular exopolysaccharide synthesis family protein [Jeotgalibacillus terrae]
MSLPVKKHKAEKRFIITQQQPMSPYSEQYRVIRTNLEFLTQRTSMKTIAVTSADKEQGTTTSLVNIGVVMAQKGKKVLLIDGNIRNPALHLFFRKKNQYGLTDILADPHMRTAEYILPTSVEGLSVLTSGSQKGMGIDLISEQFTVLLEKFKRIYDVILIDCPPVVENANAQIITSCSDGSVMVIRFGKTKKDKALKAKENLEKGSSHFVGTVVLDKRKLKKAHFF